MGHSNIATTMDVYGHLMPNTDADLAEDIGAKSATLHQYNCDGSPSVIKQQWGEKNADS